MVFRIQPKMPAANYKTYAWSAPLETHWRHATCEEYECAAFLNGWVTTVDVSTELGQKQAHYIRHDRSRKCREEKVADCLIKFVYGPGNTCFRQNDPHIGHRVPIGKPPRFAVLGGDWRGNPRGVQPRVHKRAEDWIEDFAEHQDKLSRIIERG